MNLREQSGNTQTHSEVHDRERQNGTEQANSSHKSKKRSQIRQKLNKMIFLSNIIVLFLTAVPFVEACSIGATKLEYCGQVGEPTAIKNYLDDSCDYMITIVWGDVSIGYNVYSEELMADSNRTFSLAEYTVEYNYRTPGDYTIDVVIRGYESLNASTINDFRIEAEKKGIARVAIRDDYCEDLTDSAAVSTWNVGIAITFATFLVGMLIS